MNQIRHTKPVKIRKREDGLNEYQYELHGVVEAKCTIFCKTIKEAIANAKLNIKKYLDRVAQIMKVTEGHKLRNGLVPENTITGWTGIKFNQASAKWDVEIDVNGQIIDIGSYTKKSIAVSAIRTANIKYGLPEFSGKLTNVNK